MFLAYTLQFYSSNQSSKGKKGELYSSQSSTVKCRPNTCQERNSKKQQLIKNNKQALVMLSHYDAPSIGALLVHVLRYQSLKKTEHGCKNSTSLWLTILIEKKYSMEHYFTIKAIWKKIDLYHMHY